jgi:hypothetical protein
MSSINFADNPRILAKWTKLFYDAGDKTGRTFRVTEGIMEQSARDAGFTDIVKKVYTVPHGVWPKDKRLKLQGQFLTLYMDMSLDGFALYPIGEIMGWTFEEVQVLVAQMRNIVKNPRHLVSGDMHMVYGRKPE